MNKFFFVLLSILLVGCATPELYHWGSYENTLYKSFKEGGSFTVEEQIDLLQKDIDTAQSKELKVAPGVFAQLGYLYFQVGDNSAAKNAFQTESRLFPESKKFMDRLISKINIQ